MHPAAWHPDPTGRHQFRYWDGAAWTDHVADDGITKADPLDTSNPSDTAVQASHVSLDTLDQELKQLRRELAELSRLLVSGGISSSATDSVGSPEPHVLRVADARNTVATASAIIGTIALITAFIPVFGVLGVIAGIGAIILGVVGRNQAKESLRSSSSARAGIITGSLAAIIGITVSIALIVALNSPTIVGEFRQYTQCVQATGDAETCAAPYENSDLFRLFG